MKAEMPETFKRLVCAVVTLKSTADRLGKGGSVR